MAAESATRAGLNADVASEVATMAEQAASHAVAAAERARNAATAAHQLAEEDRLATIDADTTETKARAFETGARDAYHVAEAEARARHRT